MKGEKKNRRAEVQGLSGMKSLAHKLVRLMGL